MPVAGTLQGHACIAPRDKAQSVCEPRRPENVLTPASGGAAAKWPLIRCLLRGYTVVVGPHNSFIASRRDSWRPLMSMLNIFNVAGSAVSAQSQRLNVIASNLANADTVAGPDGRAYKARQVVFTTTPMGG